MLGILALVMVLAAWAAVMGVLLTAESHDAFLLGIAGSGLAALAAMLVIL